MLIEFLPIIMGFLKNLLIKMILPWIICLEESFLSQESLILLTFSFMLIMLILLSPFPQFNSIGC